MKRCKNKTNISIVKDYLAGIHPSPMVGYIGDKNKYHKDGDVWKDGNGIEWQRKGNKTIRLTKTQADVVREAIGKSKCKCGLDIRWGNKFDTLFFAKTGMCQDCLVEYEHKLRAVGIYPLYEAYKIYSNQLSMLHDAKSKLEETIEYFSKNDGSIEILCNSDGFRERFHGTNKEVILENAARDLNEANTLITKVTENKKIVKKNLTSMAKEYKIKVYV